MDRGGLVVGLRCARVAMRVDEERRIGAILIDTHHFVIILSKTAKQSCSVTSTRHRRPFLQMSHTETSLKATKNTALKSILAALSLPTTGLKQVLIDRILTHQQNTQQQQHPRKRGREAAQEEPPLKRSKQPTHGRIASQLRHIDLVSQLNNILVQAKDSLTKSTKGKSTNDPLRTVEVEARLGTRRPFSDAESQDLRSKKSRMFDPGTTKSFFYQAIQTLSSYKGWKDVHGASCAAPTERTTYDILYDSSGPTARKQNIRVEIDAATGKCTGHVIFKRKLNDPIDTEIENHYDLRVTVANEHPHPDPGKYIHLAESLFERPSSDLSSPSRLQRMWDLMRRGCPVRPKVGKTVTMSKECHQGVSERDELLRLIRTNGHQLNSTLARGIHWTVLNVDKFRSIDGHALHRSQTAPTGGSPPTDGPIAITCLPGKLFKGKSKQDRTNPKMWHHFPICGYTGKIYMQDLEMINASMLVKGIPDSTQECDRPVEYRKKKRWSFQVMPGLTLDLTITQQSKRSVQDTEMALRIYEMEFEIDFSKLTVQERNARDYRPLLERFVGGICKLLYTE